MKTQPPCCRRHLFYSSNLATISFNICACWLSSSLTAAASSDTEEFEDTTFETWSIPFFIWLIPILCSCAAVAIELISSATFSMPFTISAKDQADLKFLPSDTFSMVLKISADVLRHLRSFPPKHGLRLQ